MTFEEILDQAIAMLQRRGRLTYGTLKRQFQLNDAYLEDLKAELIVTVSFPLVRNGADCIRYISARRAIKAAQHANRGAQCVRVKACQSAGLCRSDTVDLRPPWRKQHDDAVCPHAGNECGCGVISDLSGVQPGRAARA
jgi:hypothetical protein